LLVATAEALRANIDWKSAISLQRGPVDTEFHVVPTILLFRKLGCDLSYGIKIWTHRSFVLSQITHKPMTDRQTDRRNSHR